MKWISVGSLIIPPELLLPLLTMAGLLWVLQMKKIAGGIIAVVLLIEFSPLLEGVVEAVLEPLPMWLIWAVFIFFILGVLGLFSELLLGKGAADHLKADLAGSTLKFMLGLPFRLIGAVFRLFFGRRQE